MSIPSSENEEDDDAEWVPDPEVDVAAAAAPPQPRRKRGRPRLSPAAAAAAEQGQRPAKKTAGHYSRKRIDAEKKVFIIAYYDSLPRLPKNQRGSTAFNKRCAHVARKMHAHSGHAVAKLLPLESRLRVSHVIGRPISDYRPGQTCSRARSLSHRPGGAAQVEVSARRNGDHLVGPQAAQGRRQNLNAGCAPQDDKERR